MKHYDEDQLIAWQKIHAMTKSLVLACGQIQQASRSQISIIKKRQATRLRGRHYRQRLFEASEAARNPAKRLRPQV